MGDAIAVETDAFEHRQVKPHFINPCCFGEDFAAWLKGELTPLAAAGFSFSELIQEDYGWGFWAAHGKTRFWIAYHMWATARKTNRPSGSFRSMKVAA
jgi:hypothetical protein